MLPNIGNRAINSVAPTLRCGAAAENVLKQPMR
jgi:hypothetical protein